MPIKQLQITQCEDDTFVISCMTSGEMFPTVYTAPNPAAMAARARELFEGPITEVPFLVHDAFDRDHVTAVRAVLDMLQGHDDDEDDDETAVLDPLNPTPPLLF